MVGRAVTVLSAVPVVPVVPAVPVVPVVPEASVVGSGYAGGIVGCALCRLLLGSRRCSRAGLRGSSSLCEGGQRHLAGKNKAEGNTEYTSEWLGDIFFQQRNLLIYLDF